nr:hypothetical protein [Tanacetum cinerariifolium]
QEGRENIDHEAVGRCQNLADVLIDNGVEDDGARLVFFGSLVDLLDHRPGLLDAVDIGPGELVEGYVFKLRQQALTKRFGCDAGAVGDKESGS